MISSAIFISSVISLQPLASPSGDLLGGFQRCTDTSSVSRLLFAVPDLAGNAWAVGYTVPSGGKALIVRWNGTVWK
jgi:hypothetical protein